ncbi:hypothetical protein CPC16_009091 [Podila verticillata]|nr:hypothetical protein CPC16_009091 [Podila verticillata]
MTSPETQNFNETEHAPEPSELEPIYVSTAKPRPPLTPEEIENSKKPKVMIVGAGLGGLTLAILLHKANIPFDVYERAKEVKPLGSAMSLGGNVAGFFEQLGIYEEFTKLGKPSNTMQLYKEDLTPNFTLDFSARKALSGTSSYIIARPDIYALLLRQVPKERIHMGKKVMSILQNELGVMIRCSDNSTHHGDILVGADGAYSGVRQDMYKGLKKKNLLPKSDDAPLPFSCVCLVGQTEVLDAEEFPQVKLDHSQFRTVHGSSNMYSVYKNSSKENDSFRNSEWGPEAAEAMCKQVRHFKVPGDKEGQILTMGDLIDRTPKDLISKVVLEEKVFETWFNGRTVLLGDACHKLNPAAGVGAITAMHDAVALANWIATLQTKDRDELSVIFKEYYEERYLVAKAGYATSQMFSRLGAKGFLGAFTKAMFKRIPAWLWRKVVVKMSIQRPQLSFLPLVEDKGTAEAAFQPSLHKTLAILKERESGNGTVAV